MKLVYVLLLMFKLALLDFNSRMYPAFYIYLTAEIRSVNGSSATGLCLRTLSVGSLYSGCDLRFYGSESHPGVLYDTRTYISTHIDGDKWASLLLTMQTSASTTQAIIFDFTINLYPEDCVSILDHCTHELSPAPSWARVVEVVMFNCPAWGIATNAISVLGASRYPPSPFTWADADLQLLTTMTINPRILGSCDSLVRVCIPINTTLQILALKFSLPPESDWVHLAEVGFYTDVDSITPPCPTLPTLPVLPSSPSYIPTTTNGYIDCTSMAPVSPGNTPSSSYVDHRTSSATATSGPSPTPNPSASIRTWSNIEHATSVHIDPTPVTPDPTHCMCGELQCEKVCPSPSSLQKVLGYSIAFTLMAALIASASCVVAIRKCHSKFKVRYHRAGLAEEGEEWGMGSEEEEEEGEEDEEEHLYEEPMRLMMTSVASYEPLRYAIPSIPENVVERADSVGDLGTMEASLLSPLDIEENGNSLNPSDDIINSETTSSSQLNSTTFANSDEIRDIAPQQDSETEVVNDANQQFDLQSNDAYGAELERTEHRGYENILEDI